MAADPSEAPNLWDHPTLEGQPIPGTRVVRTSGGDRSQKVEQQQQPGYAGAFTMVKLEDMATVSYRIECVDKAARDAVKPFLEVLRKGQKQRPKPAVYRFSDPALEHNEIRSVVVQSIGGWTRDEKRNLYSVDLVLAEWKKRVPVGGPTAPRAKTDIEKQIEALNDENKKLASRLDAMNKGK
ncbi:MAG: hypothetical protein U0441_14915 [Polyangiaceae bacterium]